MHTLISRLKRVATIATILVTFLLIGCGGGGGGSAPPPATGTTPQSLNVTIQWAANNEKRVNQMGGGYNVYISQTSGFAINSVSPINVPYVSGSSLAPTSTVRLLSSGTYYVRVAAYTSFPIANTASTASTQITVTVPFTLP